MRLITQNSQNPKAPRAKDCLMLTFTARQYFKAADRLLRTANRINRTVTTDEGRAVRDEMYASAHHALRLLGVIELGGRYERHPFSQISDLEEESDEDFADRMEEDADEAADRAEAYGECCLCVEAAPHHPQPFATNAVCSGCVPKAHEAYASDAVAAPEHCTPGWALFNEHEPRGPEIQKDDDLRVFEDDDAAIDHVRGLLGMRKRMTVERALGLMAGVRSFVGGGS